MESVEETPDEVVTDEVETTMGSAEEPVDLDYEYALARAAILLDHAGEIAIKRQDIDAILSISSGWLTLSNMLSSNDEGDGDEESSSGPIGFVGGL